MKFIGRVTEQGALLAWLDSQQTSDAPLRALVLGPRGSGRTSLLRAFARQVPRGAVVVVAEVEPRPVARAVARLARRATELLLAPHVPETGSKLRLAVPRAAVASNLATSDLDVIDSLLREAEEDPLPRLQRLAEVLDAHVVLALDGVDRIASARGRVPLLEALAVDLPRIGLVYGAVALDEPQVADFEPLVLHPLSPQEARDLLPTLSPAEVERVYAFTGARTVALHAVARVLRPGLTDAEVTRALQYALLDDDGPMAAWLHARTLERVQRAGSLGDALDALAEKPRRIAELGRALGVATGAAATYAQRLGDLVRIADDRRTYDLSEPLLTARHRWAHHEPDLPVRHFGQPAERRVAAELARMGARVGFGPEAPFQLDATWAERRVLVRIGAESAGTGEVAARYGARWLLAEVDGEDVRLVDPATDERVAWLPAWL